MGCCRHVNIEATWSETEHLGSYLYPASRAWRISYLDAQKIQVIRRPWRSWTIRTSITSNSSRPNHGEFSGGLQSWDNFSAVPSAASNHRIDPHVIYRASNYPTAETVLTCPFTRVCWARLCSLLFPYRASNQMSGLI